MDQCSLHALKSPQIWNSFSASNEAVDQCQFNDTPKVDCIFTQIDNLAAVAAVGVGWGISLKLENHQHVYGSVIFTCILGTIYYKS